MPWPALRRFALCSALLVLFVAAVRGLVLAGRSLSNEGGGETLPRGDAEVLVYNDDTGRPMRMSLDEYLVGVVSAEMPASFEPEALKAQAVAARTFTVRHLKAYGGTPCGRGGCDICTDSACCQAWRSDEALRERFGSGYDYYMSRVRDAVEATSGEVVLYGGRPIDALYHSNSGGVTEDGKNVFGGDVPYLQSVASPGEESAAHYKNSLTFSRKAFAKKLNAAFKGAGLSARGLAGELGVVSRFPSGRVEKFRVGRVTATGREMRKALGLDSTNFTISVRGDTVRVDTLGFGHGVGMSQYGANAMARNGSDYVEILTHYYTGVTIGSLSGLNGAD